MEEKKLTDEAVNATAKSLKWVCNQIPNDLGNSNEEKMLKCIQLYCQQGIAVIERLQDENKQLKSNKFASWKLKFFRLKEEFDKELSEHEEFTKKAKAEIERLTEENKQLEEEIDLEVDLQTQRKRQIIAESQEFIDELANKNAELQKQVDKLENRFENKPCCNMSENCSMIQQAVKDTAKEIYSEIDDSDILVLETQD